MKAKVVILTILVIASLFFTGTYAQSGNDGIGTNFRGEG
jgi:hypothetical protein